jgi:hypothetical protein
MARPSEATVVASFGRFLFQWMRISRQGDIGRARDPFYLFD